MKEKNFLSHLLIMDWPTWTTALPYFFHLILLVFHSFGYPSTECFGGFHTLLQMHGKNCTILNWSLILDYMASKVPFLSKQKYLYYYYYYY